MEIIFILTIAVLFNAMIGNWARNWGRSFLGFFLLGIVVSPLISAAVLLIMGKARS